MNFDEESLFGNKKLAIEVFPEELPKTERYLYEQRIQYLEGEVKFLRDLLNRISGISS